MDNLIRFTFLFVAAMLADVVIDLCERINEDSTVDTVVKSEKE